MTPLVKKLQLKDDDGIRVLHAPSDVELDLPAADDVRSALRFRPA